MKLDPYLSCIDKKNGEYVSYFHSRLFVDDQSSDNLWMAGWSQKISDGGLGGIC